MVTRIKELLGRLHEDESGAMSVEKIMILLGISLPILLLIYIYRDKFITLFSSQSDKLINDADKSGQMN